MRWIGLGDDRLLQVFPNLSNFKDKTLAILS